MSAVLAGPETLVPPVPGTSLPSAIAYTYKRFPLTIVRGEGVTLIDDTGRVFLDWMSGIAVNALGYDDAGVKQAMVEAMESGLLHLSNLVKNEPAERLARFLVDHTSADKVFFCNSGVEAVEGSFKFARRWARTHSDGGVKHEIFALRGSFHGRLFASVAATDRPQYRLPFRPLVPGIGILERDIEEIAAAISSEMTAAVIVEPVQGEGGVRPIDPGLLCELRSLTRERDVLMICDEIQCGLGRTGAFLASDAMRLDPDIVTLAKPLAGGLPMGAILLKEHVARALQPGEHGTTFGGGPFVSHVAHHVVQRLADPAFLRQVSDTGAWFRAQLEGLVHELPHLVRAVRGAGLMWGVDTTEPAGAIIERARAEGLLLLSAGEHTLRILPPLVITREELGRGVAMLRRALHG